MAELARDYSALDLERALDAREVSELIGVSTIVLAHWRLRGEGPPFFKAGTRSVRYRLGDVIAWRDARMAGAK
jgi:predicted DNA-binding transcriptional regulator AlpA